MPEKLDGIVVLALIPVAIIYGGVHLAVYANHALLDVVNPDVFRERKGLISDGLHLNPRSKTLLFQRARIEILEKQDSKAVQTLVSLLHIDDRYFEAHFLLAKLQKSSDAESARFHLNLAIQLHEEKKAHYYAQSRWKKVQEAVSKLVEARSAIADIIPTERHERHKEGRKILRSLLFENYYSVSCAYLTRAQWNVEKCHLVEAESDFAKSQNTYALAYFYLCTRRFHDCVSVSHKQETPQVVYLRAAAHYFMGEYELQKQLVETAKAASTSCARPLFVGMLSQDVIEIIKKF